jgi:hypothetical protein
MELFGDFYAEKILPLEAEQVTARQLLGYPCWENVEIAPNLFGWQVRAEEKHIFDCRSEEEARYVSVFLQLGKRELLVPNDDAYLAQILPRLEYLKRRADECYDNRMSFVFNRKLRDSVRRKLYRALLWTTAEKIVNMKKIKRRSRAQTV